MLCWTPVSFCVFSLCILESQSKMPMVCTVKTNKNDSSHHINNKHLLVILLQNSKKNKTTLTVRFSIWQTKQTNKTKKRIIVCVCVCESWIVQKEEIFCVVCFMFQLKHMFFLSVFLRVKIQLESRGCFSCVW